MGSISTRKLVIKTAKLSITTASSGNEAIETLERFPTLDAAILNAADWDVACAELVKRLREIVPNLPLLSRPPMAIRTVTEPITAFAALIRT